MRKNGGNATSRSNKKLQEQRFIIQRCSVETIKQLILAISIIMEVEQQANMTSIKLIVKMESRLPQS